MWKSSPVEFLLIGFIQYLKFYFTHSTSSLYQRKLDLYMQLLKSQLGGKLRYDSKLSLTAKRKELNGIAVCRYNLHMLAYFS